MVIRSFQLLLSALGLASAALVLNRNWLWALTNCSITQETVIIPIGYSSSTEVALVILTNLTIISDFRNIIEIDT